jgi:hypothetical protein
VADNPYTRRKCGYKIQHYASGGTPAIAGPVGVNRRILSELGLLDAEGIDEWTDAILKLLEASTEAGAKRRRPTAPMKLYDAWLARWTDAVGLPALGA